MPGAGSRADAMLSGGGVQWCVGGWLGGLV